MSLQPKTEYHWNMLLCYFPLIEDDCQEAILQQQLQIISQNLEWSYGKWWMKRCQGNLNCESKVSDAFVFGVQRFGVQKRLCCFDTSDLGHSLLTVGHHTAGVHNRSQVWSHGPPNALTFLTLGARPPQHHFFSCRTRYKQWRCLHRSHCCERYMIYDHVCHTQQDCWQGLSFVRSKVLLWSFLLPVSWFVSSWTWKDFCLFFFLFYFGSSFIIETLQFSWNDLNSQTSFRTVHCHCGRFHTPSWTTCSFVHRAGLSHQLFVFVFLFNLHHDTVFKASDLLQTWKSGDTCAAVTSPMS